MSGAVSLLAVGRAMRAWFEDTGTSLLLHDRATGDTLPVAAKHACDPSGLLPVFLAAGEAVWREATGKGFGLRIRRDPAAMLGYRVDGIGGGTFATVLLSTMEAVVQAQDGQAQEQQVQEDQTSQLLVNGLLGAVWQAVLDRSEAAGPWAPALPGRSPAPGSGAHP